MDAVKILMMTNISMPVITGRGRFSSEVAVRRRYISGEEPGGQPVRTGW
jgi:hypothetical protein